MNQRIERPRRSIHGQPASAGLLAGILVACRLASSGGKGSANEPANDGYEKARDLLELRRQLIGMRMAEVKKVAPQLRSGSGWGSIAYPDDATTDPESEGHIDPNINYILEPYLFTVNVFDVILDVEFYNEDQHGKSKSAHLRSDYYGIWGIRQCALLDESGKTVALVEWTKDRRILTATGLEHLAKSEIRVTRDERGRITELSLPDN
jgi:hypothetical protein